MSGADVSEALELRFAEVGRREVARLERKLAGLCPAQRASAEAIIADVIRALARTPAAALAHDDRHQTIEAIVQLFCL